jgi:hypothetical protein
MTTFDVFSSKYGHIFFLSFLNPSYNLHKALHIYELLCWGSAQCSRNIGNGPNQCGPFWMKKWKRENCGCTRQTLFPPQLIEAGIKPLPLERHWKKGEQKWPVLYAGGEGYSPFMRSLSFGGYHSGYLWCPFVLNFVFHALRRTSCVTCLLNYLRILQPIW